MKSLKLSTSFRLLHGRRKLSLLLEEEATGYLIDLWLSSVESHPDGILSGMDAMDISIEAGYKKDPDFFVDCLIKAGLLWREDGTYFLKDFGTKTREKKQKTQVEQAIKKPIEAAQISEKRDGEIAKSEGDFLEDISLARADTCADAYEYACARGSYNKKNINTPPFFSPHTDDDPDALKEKKNGESIKRMIDKNWTPQLGTLEIMPALGIPREFAEKCIPHFRLFHLEKKTLAVGFESLFVGWVKNAWSKKPDEAERPKGRTLVEQAEWLRQQNASRPLAEIAEIAEIAGPVARIEGSHAY